MMDWLITKGEKTNRVFSCVFDLCSAEVEWIDFVSTNCLKLLG